MRSCGQCRTVSHTMAIASRGEGGSCGHHHVTAGWRAVTAAAIICALKERGDERKPCKYNRCVASIRQMVDAKRYEMQNHSPLRQTLSREWKLAVQEDTGTAPGGAPAELVKRSVDMILAQTRAGGGTALVMGAILGFIFVPAAGWL